MEIVVGGKKLHHGKSTIYVEVETNDPRSDTVLLLKGEVVPLPNAAAITIQADLLIR